MKLKLIVLALFAAAAVFHLVVTRAVTGHSAAASRNQSRGDKYRPVGTIEDESEASGRRTQSGGRGRDEEEGGRAREAPAGFDNLTNGFNEQGPPFETLNEDNVVALRSFNDNRFIFEEVESVADGVGPTYNAQSCRECHQNVATGGASQVAEHRTGRTDDGVFFGS